MYSKLEEKIEILEGLLLSHSAINKERLFRFGTLWWIKNSYFILKPRKKDFKNKRHPCAYTASDKMLVRGLLKAIPRLVPGASTPPKKYRGKPLLTIPRSAAQGMGLTEETYLLVRWETPVLPQAMEEGLYIGEMSNQLKSHLVNLLLECQKDRLNRSR